MNKINEFKDLLAGKNVLYVPIISCINRQTGLYDLSADGNVNRFITAFSESVSHKSITIVLPELSTGRDRVDSWAETFGIKLLYVIPFGKHAGEQRFDRIVVENMLRELAALESTNTYDLYITESQLLTMNLLLCGKVCVFYNPVSRTESKTRDFLEGYDEYNHIIARKAYKMIVCSPDQYEYFVSHGIKEDSLIYMPRLINRDLPIFNYEKDNSMIQMLDTLKKCGKKIYYLPYRLTDQGYCIDEVVKWIKNDCAGQDGIILYTDPNHSGQAQDLLKGSGLKTLNVPTNRDTYYTTIDWEGSVVIPYFEDLTFINHAAIHEFAHFKAKCKVILKTNEYYKGNERFFEI